jgi:hypothetical protein
MKATLLRTSSRRPAASCAATVRSVLRAATALSILALLAGCGNDNAQQSSTLAKAPRATAAATPTPPKPRLRLTVRRLPKRTSGDSVTIRGTVSRARPSPCEAGAPGSAATGSGQSFGSGPEATASLPWPASPATAPGESVYG